MRDKTARKILVIDDHTIVILGIKLLLTKEMPEVKVLGMSNIDKAIKYIEKNKIDVIIMDINMPMNDSTNLISQILARSPESRILIYSTNPEKHYAKRYIKLGAYGYLNKEAPHTELLSAIKAIATGQKYFSAKVTQQLMNDKIHGVSDNIFDTLSSREIEVTKLMLQGLSSQEICKIMNIHSSTMGTYKSRILEKLGVSNVISMAELAKLYHFNF